MLKYDAINKEKVYLIATTVNPTAPIRKSNKKCCDENN